MQHLKHRAPRLDHPVGRQSLAQQVLPGDAAIRQVDVGDMVDDLPVGLLRHPLVEAPVPRFHVEDWDMALFGRDGTQAAVGVAQHQEGIGPDLLEHRLDVDQDLSDRGRGGSPCGIEEIVGLADAQVLIKYLVEFVVVILARMYGDVLDGIGGIQGSHHPRQAYDFGARAHNGHYFKLLHIV